MKMEAPSIEKQHEVQTIETNQYQKVNSELGESKENEVDTRHHRGSMHSSMLTHHFSSTRGKDEKVELTWKNLNYSTLVKSVYKIV